MSQQALSPLVQVTHTPSLVHSHLQMARAMLHWQMHMPFIMQLQLHMPSHIIRHRFCSVAQATSSSQAHTIFIPPAHRSILMVQRGRTMQFAAAGMLAGAAGMGIPMPVFPIVRSIIMTLAIEKTSIFFVTGAGQDELGDANERELSPSDLVAPKFCVTSGWSSRRRVRLCRASRSRVGVRTCGKFRREKRPLQYRNSVGKCVFPGKYGINFAKVENRRSVNS